MINGQLKIFNIKDDCTGCGACVSACPKECLTLKYDEEGFLFPTGDLANCINCHKCERVCHVLSDDVRKNLGKPVWWEKSIPIMFVHNDEDIRLKSTSGGAMSVLAASVLAAGGIVFASHYNGKLKQLEFASTDEYPLADFRKSRYIESNTNNIFKRVKAEISKDRKVLFIGTPCQISGLKHFLGKNKDADNLLTVNFICHGVPSNEVFHQHISKKYHIDELKNVDFRFKDKKHGWRQLCLKLYGKNKEKTISNGADEFYRSFYKNDYLRRSCYSCNYLFNDFSDITIADFWGINRYDKSKDDNKGISLIILHSPKAINLSDMLKANGECEPLPYSSIEYITNERKSYCLQNRFAGNKKDYQNYITEKYKWIIRKFIVRQWIKAIIKR